MIADNPPQTYTAFLGHTRLAAGAPAHVALAVRRAIEGGEMTPIMVFDDATGQIVDLDLRGDEARIAARLTPPPSAPAEPRGRGRPKLGVVAREVTLLPRHWEWLARQPGGASVALRKLVETARHAHAGADAQRAARETAYRFMSAMAGDLPRFEEASRALFADDEARLADQIADWPQDVRDHVLVLLARH